MKKHRIKYALIPVLILAVCLFSYAEDGRETESAEPPEEVCEQKHPETPEEVREQKHPETPEEVREQAQPETSEEVCGQEQPETPEPTKTVHATAEEPADTAAEKSVGEGVDEGTLPDTQIAAKDVTPQEEAPLSETEETAPDSETTDSGNDREEPPAPKEPDPEEAAYGELPENNPEESAEPAEASFDRFIPNFAGQDTMEAFIGDEAVVLRVSAEAKDARIEWQWFRVTEDPAAGKEKKTPIPGAAGSEYRIGTAEARNEILFAEARAIFASGAVATERTPVVRVIVKKCPEQAGEITDAETEEENASLEAKVPIAEEPVTAVMETEEAPGDNGVFPYDLGEEEIINAAEADIGAPAENGEEHVPSDTEPETAVTDTEEDRPGQVASEEETDGEDDARAGEEQAEAGLAEGGLQLLVYGTMYELTDTGTYRLVFTVEPPEAADARITVTDEKGNVVAPEADGSFILPDSVAHRYTAAKYGYRTVQGTIGPEGGDAGITMVSNAVNDFEDVGSQWSSFRNSDTNMGITDAKTPTDPESTSLLWHAKLGEGWASAPSLQIIVDDAIFCMSGTTLYKLSLDTGEVLGTAAMKDSCGFGYTPMTYADGLIFCPLSNGTIQAFNAKTMASVWVYQDELKGQVLSPIAYSDGYIYTGFWNGESKDANFVCVSVSDDDAEDGAESKAATWVWKQKGGFYWAGAVIVNDAVIVTTDDGKSGYSGTSMLYSFHKKDGDVISSLSLSGMGDARSSVSWDEKSGRVYFSTKNGFLCSAALDPETGRLSDLKADNKKQESTSTPLVYGDRVYYATGSGISSSGSSGQFVVADAETLETLYTVDMKGYPQNSMLLSTAYTDEEGYLYFYSTYNAKPGGISLIKVKADGSGTADDAEVIELYGAEGFEEYCITSIICSQDGTLFYKNDSGNVFAVGTPTYGKTIQLIKNIGTVTEKSANAVTAARASYDALGVEEQAQVSNLAVLEQAETAISAITEEKIASIGEVTFEKEELIQGTAALYGSLTPRLKEMVGNAAVLEQAQETLSDLKVAEAERLIGLIPLELTKENREETEAALTAAETYLDGLSDAERARVKNYGLISEIRRKLNPPEATGKTRKVDLEDHDDAYDEDKVREVAELIAALWEDAFTTGESEQAFIEVVLRYRALSEAEKKAVGGFEKLSALAVRYGERHHTDPVTGVRVEGLDWYIRLVVRPLEEELLRNGLGSLLEDNGRMTGMYMITLENVLTGETYAPSGIVTVKLPIPAPEEKQTALALTLDGEGRFWFILGSYEEAEEGPFFVSKSVPEEMDGYLVIETNETGCWFGTTIVNGSWEDLFAGDLLRFDAESFQECLARLRQMTASGARKL